MEKIANVIQKIIHCFPRTDPINHGEYHQGYFGNINLGLTEKEMSSGILLLYSRRTSKQYDSASTRTRVLKT